MSDDATPGSFEAPPMRINCPHCGSTLEGSAASAGDTTTCPQCNGKFQVPTPVASAASGAGFAAGAGSANSNARAFAEKKIIAGICGILLGSIGIHKFVLGQTNGGIILLTLGLIGYVLGGCLCFPFGLVAITGVIGLIEGILYLVKSDEEFYQIYAVERRQWF